jgi:glucosamine--fructose-6-phosphate aminotransferase (isomerizing)
MARRKAPAIPDEVLDQLLSGASASTAYHVATLTGTDVDQPRNLAKSVTVE